MLYLIAGLVLVTAGAYGWLRQHLAKGFAKAETGYGRIKNDYERLLQENVRLKNDNLDLHKELEQTVILYETTKQICRTLESDKVFSAFREILDTYIAVDDCRFVAHKDADLSLYSEYTVLPLEIYRVPIGYLIASGIEEKDKDKFHILAHQFILGAKRAILYQRVQELAVTDALTGVSSRRYYLERAKEEVERSRKFSHIFSCLMIDIDHFKDYNDRYGHLVGDGILKEVSRIIKENIRQIDLLCRYGGEEFSLILTDTDNEQARFAAERIRQEVGDKHIKVYDEELQVTISVGISTFPRDGQEIEEVIDRADMALYQAKNTGRNRVCVYR